MQDNLAQGGGVQVFKDDKKVTGENVIQDENTAVVQNNDPENPGVVVEGGETVVPPAANPALLAMIDSYNPQNIMTDAAADIAREQAVLMQSRDMITAEQNAIASRANIERNATQGQRQALLGEYSTQQTIEKMGWTGGYRTDADTQMSYLKASIGADLYGQMELQRLGYETALEQARLNYSLNNIQLANDYMNQQWQIEFQRANITGELISPIDRENVNQFKAAQTIITSEDGTYSAEEVAKAQQVYNQLLEWYGGEGVGQEGLNALYEIANLTRNAQQFEMNQAQLDQIELNMTLSVQSAVREIKADGEIPIVERNEEGNVTNVYGISPTSTTAEDIAKIEQYYNENPLEFVSLIENYERYQVNQYLAALDAGTYTGTYEGFLETYGSDQALELYERFADAAGYEEAFPDPFNGEYRKTSGEQDQDTSTTDYNALINNPSLTIAQRNTYADQFFREQGIDPKLYSGTSSRAKYNSYLNVQDLIKNGADSEVKIDDFYQSLASIVLKDQGGADDKEAAAKMNALYRQILGDDIEFGFIARPALAGAVIASNNGFILTDREGNDLSQADYNALPEAQRKMLEDMGFIYAPGRNRYLFLQDEASSFHKNYDAAYRNKPFINGYNFSGDISRQELQEEKIIRSAIYHILKYQYDEQQAAANVLNNFIPGVSPEDIGA